MRHLYRHGMLGVSQIDDHNFAVVNFRKVQKGRFAGKEGVGQVRYYPTLAMACRRMALLSVDQSNAETLEVYAQRLETIADDILTQLSPKLEIKK